MAIASTSWRPLASCSRFPLASVSWLCTILQRPFSGRERLPSRARPRPTKMLRSVKRFIPEEAKRFVGADGKLQTTQQNLEFLLEYGLEVDNGRMIRISAGSELSRAATNYSVTIAYSPRHIIHPFDLRYFDPRGHPMAAMVRAKYTHKTQEEPLWIMVTAAGGLPAVVRSVTQRRFTRCLHDAFRELRSEPGPKRQVARRMQGTLWITFHNPIKAARHSPERFGRVIANGLVRHCSE